MFEGCLREVIPYYCTVNWLTLWKLHDLFYYSEVFGKSMKKGLFLPSVRVSSAFLNGSRVVYVDAGKVKQDSFHFDTVFGNVVYENDKDYEFVRYLNLAINDYIESSMSTYHPCECRCAAVA